jgi:predicted nuclease of predicted toxin-antitoxin system
MAKSLFIEFRIQEASIIRTGNIPNRILLELFENNLTLIETLLTRSNLIEVRRTEIAEHS